MKRSAWWPGALVFTLEDGTKVEPVREEDGCVYTMKSASGFEVEFVLTAEFVAGVQEKLDALKTDL